MTLYLIKALIDLLVILFEPKEEKNNDYNRPLAYLIYLINKIY